MTIPRKNPNVIDNYQPSPQKPRIYTGPHTPMSYNSDWQYFINLTSDQIDWFQSQPKWKAFVATVVKNV